MDSSFCLTIALGILIVSAELFRLRRRRQGGVYVDFFLAFSLVFLVAYVLAPIYIRMNFADELISEANFTSLLQIGASFDEWKRISMVGLCTLAYLCAYAGYELGVRRSSRRKQMSAPSISLTSKELWCFSLMFLSIGTVAFLLYVNRLGGLDIFIAYGAYLRTVSDSSTEFNLGAFAFLKNVMPFVMSGTLFLFILAKEEQKGPITARWLLFGLTVGLAALIAFHRAGRLEILMYLATFAFAHVLHAGRPSIAVICGLGILFFLSVGVGRELLWSTFDQQPQQQEIGVLLNPWVMLNRLFLEVSFPCVSLGNALDTVPTMMGYRYFVDIPNAVINLIPSHLLTGGKKEILSMINTESLGLEGTTIPVDFVTFGYYSAGWFGVGLWALIWGRLLAVCENTLPQRRTVQAAALRSWMLTYISLRVFYGDPHHIIVYGIYVTLPVALLWLLRRLKGFTAATAVGPPRHPSSRKISYGFQGN